MTCTFQSQIVIIDIRTFPSPTRTTRMPSFWGYPLSPNDYPYHWVILDPKSKEDKVKVANFKNLPKFLNKHCTRHTFGSCLIRCSNMKWIRWVLLKIQSGHDSVHRQTGRRTDGQGETSIPPFQLRWSEGYNKMTCASRVWINKHFSQCDAINYPCPVCMLLTHKSPYIQPKSVIKLDVVNWPWWFI